MIANGTMTQKQTVCAIVEFDFFIPFPLFSLFAFSVISTRPLFFLLIVTRTGRHKNDNGMIQ